MKRKNDESENSESFEEQVEKRRRHNIEGRSTAAGGDATRCRTAAVVAHQTLVASHRSRAAASNRSGPALSSNRPAPTVSSSTTGSTVCGRTWSSASSRKDVTLELLEDMGVNIIEDSSNDAPEDAFDNQTKPIINLVLKNKDQNIRKPNQRSLADYSVSSEDSLDPSKISFKDYKYTSSNDLDLNTENRYQFGPDTSVPERFTKYTRGRRDNPSPGVDLFNQMVDEIVLNVFKWLPKGSLARCALVCKRWCRLIKDDSLWKRIDLGLRNIRPGIIGQVLSRGCIVLRLARSSVISPVFPQVLYPSFSTLKIFSDKDSCKLQYLDLSMATISSKCLGELLTTCKNLKKLALERCDLSDRVCSAISKNSNLEVIHLALTSGLSDVGIASLTSGFKKLTELNISWTDLDQKGLKVLCETAPRSLERICMAGYRETLEDEHVNALVSHCPRLIELDVSDATKLTVATITSIVEHLPRLESLSTSRCYGIVPSSYLLLGHCASLLYLNVYGLLRDAALSELRDRLQGIEINKYPLSSVARPTIGIKRTSLWNLRVRD